MVGMLLISILSSLVTLTIANKLVLCNDAESEELCRTSEDYENAYPPKPSPAVIHLSITIGGIRRVDENGQSITTLLEITQEWTNYNVTIKDPKSSWYELSILEIAKVWIPNIYFDKVLKIKKITTFGKFNSFDFWINPSENKHWYRETLEVTFACAFDFSNHPFDEHMCQLIMGDYENGVDWMMLNNSKFQYDEMVVTDDFTSFEILDSTTAFTFKLSKLASFKRERGGDLHHFTGILFEMKRKGLGSLLNTYYIPTAMFAVMSMISFTIEPSCVPGRMGMIVTLLLISSNVYSIVEAPKSRGLSHVETWIIGSQLPIIIALFEYGLVLLANRNWKPKFDFNKLDIISLILTAGFYSCFNIYYWVF